MVKYKVWVEIEMVDDENGIYQDASPFPICVEEFPSLEEADHFVQELFNQSTLK
jgi:hypothetical protein